MDFGFPEQAVELMAFAGVEIALWDLLGKQLALPLFRLLGGPGRERAPFATVHAVRRALGPDVQLAVDCNRGFTMDTARQFLRRTRDCSLSNIEEPVAELAGLNCLRTEFQLPISTHCRVRMY